MAIKSLAGAMMATALVYLPPAAAEQAQPQPLTVADLDSILQQEILVKAQAALAKQQAELDRYPGTVPAATSVGPAAGTALPQVAWRRATASGWLAKFLLATGTSMIATVGEALPGGYVVDQIDAGGVKLRVGDTVIDLAAATPANLVAVSNKPGSQ